MKTHAQQWVLSEVRQTVRSHSRAEFKGKPKEKRQPRKLNSTEQTHGLQRGGGGMGEVGGWGEGTLVLVSTGSAQNR